MNPTYDYIFSIGSEQEFNAVSLQIFRYQYANTEVYRLYVDQLGIDPIGVDHYSRVPFLPIEFFKSHEVISREFRKAQQVFASSGTTGSTTSRHFIADLELYTRSFMECFRIFYGDPGQYIFLALLPSYLERGDSSLVYMADKLIGATKHPSSGFYLAHNEELLRILTSADRQVILLGVTFALLDLAEHTRESHPDLILMETGGMKGRRREMVREEVHGILAGAFGVRSIHSEYGMTELLSQAYSKGSGRFNTPPWMRVFARDVNDPLSPVGNSKTGGLNIIDLANMHSCSFIATQDLGRTHADGSFEVLGRFDASDIRGCNLMVG